MGIKRILVRIYQRICVLRRMIEFCLIKATIKKVDSGEILCIEGEVFILIPHADDEWVGCSQIITRNCSNTKLINMNMDGGDSEELHQIRYKELEKLADGFGLPLITMGTSRKEKINMLVFNILQGRPQYIAVPFYYDWHEEHIQVLKMLKDAFEIIMEKDAHLLDLMKIIMYQVSVPIPQGKITHYYPMDKRSHVYKWDIFDSIYHTQKNIPWARFRYNERINGKLFQEYASEVFVMEDSMVWIKNLDKKLLTDAERDLILKNLQSVWGIRRTLRNCFR